MNKPMLDALVNKGKPRKSGCAICGDVTAASLTIVIRKNVDDNGRRAGSASRGRSFCEAHALEMWATLGEALGVDD